MNVPTPTEQAVLSSLTATEQRAIEEAVPAWIAGREHASSRVVLTGPTAEEVLSAHGVSFDADPRRYGTIVAEIQRRAYRLTGKSRPGTYRRDTGPEHARRCVECDSLFYRRTGEERGRFRVRKYCGRRSRCARRKRRRSPVDSRG